MSRDRRRPCFHGGAPSRAYSPSKPHVTPAFRTFSGSAVRGEGARGISQICGALLRGGSSPVISNPSRRYNDSVRTFAVSRYARALLGRTALGWAEAGLSDTGGLTTRTHGDYIQVEVRLGRPLTERSVQHRADSRKSTTSRPPPRTAEAVATARPRRDADTLAAHCRRRSCTSLRALPTHARGSAETTALVAPGLRSTPRSTRRADHPQMRSQASPRAQHNPHSLPSVTSRIQAAPGGGVIYRCPATAIQSP